MLVWFEVSFYLRTLFIKCTRFEIIWFCEHSHIGCNWQWQSAVLKKIRQITFWNKLIMKPWWKQWSWKTSTLWSLLTSQRKVLCLAHLKYQQPPTPSLYGPKNLTALRKSLSMQNSSWENLRIFLHNLHIMSSQLRIYDSTFCCLVGLAFSLVWLIGN